MEERTTEERTTEENTQKPRPKESGTAIIFLILSAVGTIFTAIMPIFNSVTIEGFGDYETGNIGALLSFLKQMFDLAAELKANTLKPSILMLLIFTFAACAALMALAFLISILTGKRGKKLMKSAKSSWMASLLYILTIVYMAVGMNRSMSSVLGSSGPGIVPTSIGYVILAVMLVNRLIFYPLYTMFSND